MTDKQKATEDQIFEAAARVFQRDGYAGARMQEIADEANINKSMLHYYFRSKDQLFREVFQKEMMRFFPSIFKVLGSDDKLDQKLPKLIDAYYEFLQDNPTLVQFVIQEMNNHPKELRNFMSENDIHPPASFGVQIKKEIEEGNMDPIDPRQLLISIVGLILFPFIAQVMVTTVFDLEEEDYLGFLKNRKEFLTDFILNAINYKRS
ncbi:MAG: TetR family transcriptional regulator [Balneola sp.]|jgi:AcrR family transcriptional regulator|nr:TetR family transcriptional regulator [Balneola sp.]MBE80171.1 TetR family transcriptional regulator [Balneola sp.]|tara:strand:+ start:621 stop:1238 length:618 start_codon:yes stop_codon:yes gene_type:complete